MAIKKSEIYSQIWAACDKLRGGVEPARYMSGRSKTCVPSGEPAI